MYNDSMEPGKTSHFPVTFDLVILYELFTGILESATGLGLIIFKEEIQEFYVNLRDTGFLDSYHRFFTDLLSRLIPFVVDHHIFIGIFLVCLGLGKLVSGVGLMYRQLWAEHLLIGLLLVFLPLDFFELLRHPSLVKIMFILTNLLIVLYLTRDRFLKKLFRKS